MLQRTRVTVQMENVPEHGVLHLTLNPQLVHILVLVQQSCAEKHVLQVLYQSDIHKLRLQVV